jgi:DNA-binding NarL/FixJ family response regulator
MTQHAGESTAGGPVKALLAARRPTATDTAWADVTSSAAGALASWRRQRHTHVLADFGPLACGTTGLQLARRLRAEDPNVLVFLLSDAVNPTQAMWARASGAFAVVPRSRESIAACLSGWTLHSCHGQHINSIPFDKTMQEARRIMISNLLSLGQLSPDTLSAVERAVAALGRLNAGAAASAEDMARAVARRMCPRDQYPAFLKWFTQAIPTHVRAENPLPYRLAGNMLQRHASGAAAQAVAAC